MCSSQTDGSLSDKADRATIPMVVSVVDLVLSFALGLFAPTLIPKNARVLIEKVGAEIDGFPFSAGTIALAAAAASGAAMCIMVRSLFNRREPELIMTKLIVISLPAVGAGFLSCSLFVWLGWIDAPRHFVSILAIGAAAYICGGISGAACIARQRGRRGAT